MTAVTFNLPYCTVAVVPRMFIRRKPWFKRKKGAVTIYEIDWEADTIYISRELSCGMRELALADAFQDLIKRRNFNAHNFYIDTKACQEYHKLIKLLRQKRMR